MTAKKLKILVHVCCSACASHVFKELQKAGFLPIAFFYHPEIDNPEEYSGRLQDLRQLCENEKIELVTPYYEISDFYTQIAPFKDKSSIKYISSRDRYERRRCSFCNQLAVEATIAEAKSLRVKYFTTTLLCSPYKDHDTIIEIANEKALDYHLNFYYQDFRKGYFLGRNFARNHNIYIPRYCGCDESQKEGRLE